MNRTEQTAKPNTTAGERRPDTRVTGPEFGELWRRCGLTPNEMVRELAQVEPSIRSERDLAFLEMLTVVPGPMITALRRSVSAHAFETHLLAIRAEAAERREAEADEPEAAEAAEETEAAEAEEMAEEEAEEEAAGEEAAAGSDGE